MYVRRGLRGIVTSNLLTSPEQTPLKISYLRTLQPLNFVAMSAPSHPAARGFYVFQAALGSPLQFHPALGTSELDALMDAYLPCPGSIQDKRASISVDFFDHFRLTGESIKFYEVPGWVNSANSSPNSARDSGYGSSFTASPLAPTWSWGTLDSTAVSTPSTSSSVSTPQIPSRRAQQSSRKQSTSSRAGAGDFSNLPGMKILTRDGRDVTNTATRGCKTKEQRDHAHLMRIMKACESCKKKKVRCDPSHRSLTSPVSPAQQQPARSAKKARISSSQPKPAVAAPSFEPAIFEQPASLPALPDSFEFDSFDFLNETPLDEQASWDEFLRFNGELDSVFPDGLGNLPDLQTTIPSAPNRPPASGYPDPCDVPLALAQPGDVDVQGVPGLPYMDENDQPHNYVDFNLYSPSSSFADSEPSLSTDLSVESIPRLESVGRQRSSPGLKEQLARSTVQQPESYPATKLPDHNDDSCLPELHTWHSANVASASLETVRCIPPFVSQHSLTLFKGLATHVSSSAPDSLDRQELLSTVGGWIQPSSTDAQLPTVTSQQWSQPLRTLRVPRASPESGSSQGPVVSGGEFSATASDSSLSHSQSLMTTRQGDLTAVTAALQAAAAAAGTQRSGRDRMTRVLSSGDERASLDVIDPYRGRPISTVDQHVETDSKSSQATARAVASSSDEKSRSENRQTATVVQDRTTVSGQPSCTVVTVSSQEQESGTAAPVDTEVSRATAQSCLAPTGTDGPTAVQESSRTLANVTSKDLLDLMSVATVVASTAATALRCMAVLSSRGNGAMWDGLSLQSRKTDAWASPAKRIRTRGEVRMDTAPNRIPILV